MEIRAHLTDAEMSEALAEPSRGSQAHLDDCESCRTELGMLRSAIRQVTYEAGDRPADFWVQQRRNIRARMEEPSTHSHTGARWALVFGTCVLAFALFLLRSAPTPVPQPQATVSDHELLLEVESMVGSDVPQSLEPATVLATEISRGLPAGNSMKDSKKGEQE
jgi:hypothetical protein